jgi:predicted alpha/beta-fold hydrolase
MILEKSTYNPSLPFKSSHFNTIYRTLFHSLEVDYHRERMETSDGDFMDLDFTRVGSGALVVILHGLEGSSESKYMQALSLVVKEEGLDSVSVNFRGCSGEPNRLLSSYHSGKTADLAEVFEYLDQNHEYDRYFLVGYSLGGNMALKYLGEGRHGIPSRLDAAVAVSVPCDLRGSSEEISKFWNTVYMQRFLISLKKKTLKKMEQFPEARLERERLSKVNNFFDFDNLYTAPVHGFKDAFDYWEQNSCSQYLNGIRIPSLLITATDDPFLSETCYPFKEARSHKYFHLEATRFGGHVGYNSGFGRGSGFWLEKRIVSFLEDPGIAS